MLNKKDMEKAFEDALENQKKKEAKELYTKKITLDYKQMLRPGIFEVLAEITVIIGVSTFLFAFIPYTPAWQKPVCLTISLMMCAALISIILIADYFEKRFIPRLIRLREMLYEEGIKR